jgi:hypothetical protein
VPLVLLPKEGRKGKEMIVNFYIEVPSKDKINTIEQFLQQHKFAYYDATDSDVYTRPRDNSDLPLCITLDEIEADLEAK